MRQRMGLARVWVPAGMVEEWKTTEEVQAYLRTYGLRVSENRLEEFVRRGVLSYRKREGQGRGKGSKVRWPVAQAEILRTALELQRDYGANLADCCQLVVAAWTHWGDASGVPLLQLRRAMQSWATYQWQRARRSYARAEQDARRLCRGIRHRGAVQTQEMVKDLADMVYQWNPLPEQELADRLRLVIDPDRREVARGPREAPLSPELVSHVLLARVRGLDALRRDQVPDGLWAWARAFYLTGLAEYSQRRVSWAEEVAKDRVLAPNYEAQTLESLYAIVCKELVQCVGFGLAFPQPPSLPQLWHPHLWVTGQVGVRVRTELELLPGVDGGSPVKHFQTLLAFVVPEVGAEWAAGAECREVSFGFRGTA